MASYDGDRHQYRPRQQAGDEELADLHAYPAGGAFDEILIRDPEQASAWIEGRSVDLLEVL